MNHRRAYPGSGGAHRAVLGPIKHARRIHAAHGRYPQFFDYGDAEAFRQGLERLRGQYAEAERK